MLRNFFINLFFLIPVWFLNVIFFFNKDEKRKFFFDMQSKIFLSLIPKFDIHKVLDEDISEIRDVIELKRKNLILSKKTKKIVERKDCFIGENNNIKIREYVPYKTDNSNVILFFHGGG